MVNECKTRGTFVLVLLVIVHKLWIIWSCTPRVERGLVDHLLEMLKQVQYVLATDHCLEWHCRVIPVSVIQAHLFKISHIKCELVPRDERKFQLLGKNCRVHRWSIVFVWNFHSLRFVLLHWVGSYWASSVCKSSCQGIGWWLVIEMLCIFKGLYVWTEYTDISNGLIQKQSTVDYDLHNR